MALATPGSLFDEPMSAATSNAGDKRLERAVGHVNTHWFPINPNVLSTVRKGLDEGAYDLDVSFLIQELKSDFALFTFCVKELVAVGLKEKLSPSVLSDPIKLIRWAGINRIRKIFGAEQKIPNTHHFKDTENFQGDRLRETALAASTAELLGEQRRLDGETAFCHGVVRQVGLNLIAWNYPTLYSRVIRQLQPGTTIDDELSKELGFSPHLLGMRLLRPSFEGTDTNSLVAKQSWEVYDVLCEVGEALARASNPDTYPTAEQDWGHANQFISETLGDNGVELVKRRAIEHTTAYRKVAPAAFIPLATLRPDEEIRRHRKSRRTRENPFLKGCPNHVQAALNALYAEMPLQRVDRTVVDRLLKQVVPQAGFTGGCIFVLDPGTMTLVPRATFGTIRGRRPTAVMLQSAAGAALAPLITENISTGMRPQTDLASAAFQCEQPLIERSNSDHPDAVAGIYSCVGKNRKIGVLYLEAPERDIDNFNTIATKSFKAIKQALCDALLVT